MFRITTAKILTLKLVAIELWLVDAAPLSWALLMFFIGDLWLVWHLFVPGASGIVPVVTCFATSRPEVWLTIDDGPDPQDTPRLLDALERHGARATFFLVGKRAASHPELVAEIIRRGHEIGHHTQTHPEGSFWCAPAWIIRRELDEALAVFARFGVRPRRFRPPVGFKNILLARPLAARDLVCVAWTVRGHDSFATTPDRVLDHVIPRVRAGAILLLHEGPRLHPNVRVTAIERLLVALDERGLRCVIPDDAQLR